MTRTRFLSTWGRDVLACIGLVVIFAWLFYFMVVVHTGVP